MFDILVMFSTVAKEGTLSHTHIMEKHLLEIDEDNSSRIQHNL